MDIKLKELNSYSREVLIDLKWDEIEQDFIEATKKLFKSPKGKGNSSGQYG